MLPNLSLSLLSSALCSCGTITDTTPGSISTISCNGMEGRYVTITIPDRVESLTLCEVEVYGTPVGDC